MNTALLLIDIQNDYFPGGKMELVNMENAAKVANRLLEVFRKNKAAIFHIQHLSIRPNATFFLPETTGAEIHVDVAPKADEDVIIKHYPNSFRDTFLHEKLKQSLIKKLVICGAMSHMCIDTTTRAAFDLGYQSVVVDDACTTKDLSIRGIHLPAKQVHNSYMAGLNGLFAEVVLFSEFQSLIL